MGPRFALVEIAGIDDGPGLKVRALAINGRSRTLAFLSGIADTPDYEKIMTSLQHVASLGYRSSRSRLKSWDKGEGIYEFKAPSCGVRLFCFLDIDGTMLICYNSHRKKGPDRGRSREQSREFETCHQMKRVYYKAVHDVDI